jgi:hypothetical protein
VNGSAINIATPIFYYMHCQCLTRNAFFIFKVGGDYDIKLHVPVLSTYVEIETVCLAGNFVKGTICIQAIEKNPLRIHDDMCSF